MEFLSDTNLLEDNELEVSLGDDDVVTPPNITTDDLMASIMGMLNEYEEAEKQQPKHMQPDVVDLDSFAEYEEVTIEDSAKIFPTITPPENCILISGINSAVLIKTLASVCHYYATDDDFFSYSLAIENPELPGNYITSDKSVRVNFDFIVLLLRLVEVSGITCKVMRGGEIHDITEEEVLISFMFA